MLVHQFEMAPVFSVTDSWPTGSFIKNKKKILSVLCQTQIFVLLLQTSTKLSITDIGSFADCVYVLC